SEKLEGNIKSLNIDTQAGVFRCDIVLYVSHTDQIKSVCSEIYKLDGIQHVSRIDA
ncbi:MAG: hypothetical protein J5808_06195, partial [Paludibacteraceae bacterium]|nr:hypothetical protein [Paludibacteraceae bacterium]